MVKYDIKCVILNCTAKLVSCRGYPTAFIPSYSGCRCVVMYLKQYVLILLSYKLLLIGQECLLQDSIRYSGAQDEL